jgi:hypothetical protein
MLASPKGVLSSAPRGEGQLKKRVMLSEVFKMGRLTCALEEALHTHFRAAKLGALRHKKNPLGLTRMAKASLPKGLKIAGQP